MILRRIGGVIVGAIAAYLIVQIAELVVHQIQPPPADMRFEGVKQYVGSLPAAANIVALIGWLIGTVGGTFIAAKVGKSVVAGYAVGVLLFAAGVAIWMRLPVPLWYSWMSFIIYISGTLIGVRLASPPPAAAPAPPPA